MANEKRLVYAADVKDLINGLESLPWEEDVDYLVDDLPDVDAVEVVHAEWGDGGAVDRNGNIVYKSIDCSNCFEYFKIESHDREYWKNRFKVCPFCGAKMDGGNEDG